MNTQELIEAINHAFPLSPLPTKVAGKQTPYFDEYSYVENFFTGKSWNDFSMSDLWEVYKGAPDAIPTFMSDEAMFYFLPRFMLICVLEYEEADVLVYSIIQKLTPSSNCWLNRVKFQFNRKQAHAIIGFLEYMYKFNSYEINKNDLDLAVSFWGQTS